MPGIAVADRPVSATLVSLFNIFLHTPASGLELTLQNVLECSREFLPHPLCLSPSGGAKNLFIFLLPGLQLLSSCLQNSRSLGKVQGTGRLVGLQERSQLMESPGSLGPIGFRTTSCASREA